LTIAAAVKTPTAPNAAILLKYHIRGFGGASAFSADVFAFTVVGAGSNAATGAAPPSSPPDDGGSPGFFEQLQRATQTGNGGPVQGTPRATSNVNNGSPQYVPAAAPAGAAVNLAKLATPRVKADWDSEFSSSSSDTLVSFPKPELPAVTARKVVTTSSGSVPVITRGTWRRTLPHGGGPEAVPDTHAPAASPASGQNTDLRNPISAQVPASGSDPEFASQPSLAIPALEGSVTAALPMPTNAASNTSVGELAFAARIRPQSSVDQQPSHPPSAARPIASGDPFSQTVKAAGEASAKQGDPGYDEQDGSAPVATTSLSPAAKSAFRKEEVADSATNVIESNAAPLTQPTPQSVSTIVPAEPALTAKPATAAPSAAPSEPAHLLLDKTSQATSPARSISLQVEGASGQTVDIRIASRSGDLNVAVRAGDDSVAQSLRQGLDDLESRLAQNGYHAETWHPSHSGSTPEPAAPTSNSSHSQSQQQSQSGHGSQQDRGQRDNNSSNRPRWVNQLASTLQAQSKEKGNENGIGT